MDEVIAAINTYIRDHLMVSQSNISNVSAGRQWFLNRIKNTIDADVTSPKLFGPEPFINFGSYFKGTKVKTIDEYDVLVVVDTNTGRFTNNNGHIVGLGKGTLNPNPRYASRFLKTGTTSLSPNKTLEWLKSIVTIVVRTFNGTPPSINGSAVTVRVESQNLLIDLVPAGVFHKSASDEVFYDIPDGLASDDWILTSPKDDMRLLDHLANGRDQFKNVIRICKKIRDNYASNIESFAIETAVILYGIQFTWQNNIYLDLVSVLRFISARMQAGSIPDSYDVSKNLLANVSDPTIYARIFNEIATFLEGLSRSPINQDEKNRLIYQVFEGTLS